MHETNNANDQTMRTDDEDIASAFAGREIKGLDVFKKTSDHFTAGRVQELITTMNKDVPTGGEDIKYGDLDSQHLRFWKTDRPGAPVVVFVHGGSWRVGTYLDSIGSAKVSHLLSQGYAFATVNYSLIPAVTVEAQVQEVAQAVACLSKNCDGLGIDSRKLVLMRHSSGAQGTSSLFSGQISAISAGKVLIFPASVVSSHWTDPTTTPWQNFSTALRLSLTTWSPLLEQIS